MRDPDLVQRAEQAAAALEQAWMRWRARHGLGSGPMPPVSSYVGYSVDEPWGQPRVVLGVEAAEAERLAAILDGDDRSGLSRAESAGLPMHGQPADLDPAPAEIIPAGQLPAGVQTRQGIPQSGPLVVSSATSRLASSAAPARPAAIAPSQSPGDVGARLKDLAARVTALHPRPDVRDQHQPEPTQSGLADTAV